MLFVLVLHATTPTKMTNNKTAEALVVVVLDSMNACYYPTAYSIESPAVMFPRDGVQMAFADDRHMGCDAKSFAIFDSDDIESWSLVMKQTTTSKKMTTVYECHQSAVLFLIANEELEKQQKQIIHYLLLMVELSSRPESIDITNHEEY